MYFPRQISECVILLGSLLVPTLSFLAVLGYCVFCHNSEPEIKAAAVLMVTIVSLLMSLSFFMTFRTATNTIRFCYLEDSKFNKESDVNLYEILDDAAPGKSSADPWFGLNIVRSMEIVVYSVRVNRLCASWCALNIIESRASLVKFELCSIIE